MIVGTVVGEAAPPVAIAPDAPDKAAGRLGEGVIDLQRVAARGVNPNVRFVWCVRIIRMGQIEPAVVQEATVEMLGGRAGGRVEQSSCYAAEAGYRRARDRIEVVGVGSGSLGGIRRGEPPACGPAVPGLERGSRCGRRWLSCQSYLGKGTRSTAQTCGKR